MFEGLFLVFFWLKSITCIHNLAISQLSPASRSFSFACWLTPYPAACFRVAECGCRDTGHSHGVPIVPFPFRVVFLLLGGSFKCSITMRADSSYLLGGGCCLKRG